MTSELENKLETVRPLIKRVLGENIHLTLGENPQSIYVRMVLSPEMINKRDGMADIRDPLSDRTIEMRRDINIDTDLKTYIISRIMKKNGLQMYTCCLFRG